MFSNKSKIADNKWKIKLFRQGKKYITDLMIEFKALAMKDETNNIHAIFLLKKNIRSDIIKKILGYPLMAASETLKEWKVTIISVEQEYESMESQYNYKTETGVTYRGRGVSMEIGKSRDNYDKNKGQQKLDPTNLKDLPEYIQPFIHLFNKKKFEKLLK